EHRRAAGHPDPGAHPAVRRSGGVSDKPLPHRGGVGQRAVCPPLHAHLPSFRQHVARIRPKAASGTAATYSSGDSAAYRAATRAPATSRYAAPAGRSCILPVTSPPPLPHDPRMPAESLPVRLWRDQSVSAIAAGFVTVLVGFASSAAIVFQAAQAMGATPGQTASWMWAL